MNRAKRRNETPADESVSRVPVADFFETFVSLDVECASERRLHAGALAGLVGAGLVAASVSPLAAVAGLGLAGIIVPTLVSATLLATAATLSASGRLDAVAGTLLVVLAAAGLLGLVLGGAAGLAGGAAFAIAALGGVALAGRLNAARRSRLAAAETLVRREDECAATRLAGPVLRFDAVGRLVEVPAEAEALFGAVPGGGLALVERIHLLDRVAYLDAFAKLRRGAGVAELELRLTGGGAERHVTLRLAALDAGSGGAGTVLGIACDVTEERQAARRLALTLAQAEEASQAKSRFLAAISHELRTPLNAIIGFTDILDQEFFGGFESDRQKEYVHLIGRSGEHLLQVVNGLLDISKIEAGRYEIAPEAFSPREAMEAAAAMVRPEAEKKGLVLIVQEPAEGTFFRADRRAFHQILLNLLSNAVKFTDEGCVRISARLEGGTQIVEIEDTGIGIAASDLARIARPFVRLEGGEAEVRPGTGLGLSLAKGLCELHQGGLRIDSRLGIGTTVSAAIPVDCCERFAGEGNLKEKIVSLNDARKKTAPLEEAPAARRSA